MAIHRFILGVTWVLNWTLVILHMSILQHKVASDEEMSWLGRYMYTHLNPASATIPPTTRMFSLSSFRQSVGHYSSEECASKIHKQVHIRPCHFLFTVCYRHQCRKSENKCVEGWSPPKKQHGMNDTSLLWRFVSQVQFIYSRGEAWGNKINCTGYT